MADPSCLASGTHGFGHSAACQDQDSCGIYQTVPHYDIISEGLPLYDQTHPNIGG